MKKLFTTALFMLVLVNVNADDEAGRYVLVEYVTYFGFAPPENQGTFKLQILSDGAVVKVDSKDDVTVVATLSSQVVSAIRFAVVAVESDELTQPSGPICMDAPSVAINIWLSGRGKMKIWQLIGCREYSPVDPFAGRIVDVVRNLVSAFYSVVLTGPVVANPPSEGNDWPDVGTTHRSLVRTGPGVVVGTGPE